MLFSILIANYNNGSFFKDCFDSIMNQTYQDFEVIIVDDASTDNSVEVIEKLISKDSRFKLFHNEKNSGCGYTKRRSAELANGVICGFVDPDDAITPNALEVMVEVFKANTTASIVSSKLLFTDLNLSVIRESIHGMALPKGHSFLTYGKGAISHFASFRKDRYSKTIGINPTYKRAVDQDLYFLMEEVGSPIFVDEFLYLYRVNDNSISGNENTYKARYWHYLVMKEAYLRRKKHQTEAINFTKQQFLKMEHDYFISRIKREGVEKNYCKKYYFLFKAIACSITLDWKYKTLCLVNYSYY